MLKRVPQNNSRSNFCFSKLLLCFDFDVAYCHSNCCNLRVNFNYSRHEFANKFGKQLKIYLGKYGNLIGKFSCAVLFFCCFQNFNVFRILYVYIYWISCCAVSTSDRFCVNMATLIDMFNHLHDFGPKGTARRSSEKPPGRRLLKTKQCEKLILPQGILLLHNFFALLVLSSRRSVGCSVGFRAGNLQAR